MKFRLKAELHTLFSIENQSFYMNGERGVKMKKYLCILVFALFVLTASFGQAFAATMYDAAYDQYADLYTKVAVKGEGKAESYDPALFRIFYYSNDPTLLTGYVYITEMASGVDLAAGEAVMVNGEKIYVTLDGYGYQSIANALAQWIYEISLQEGFVITDPTIWFNFIVPPPSKIKVDKLTGEAIKKSKLKLKGLCDIEIFGQWITRKFKLKGKGEF
jgi:hypothetical protein